MAHPLRAIFVLFVCSSCAQGAPPPGEDVRSDRGDSGLPVVRDVGQPDATAEDVATDDATLTPDAAPTDANDVEPDLGPCPAGCGANEQCVDGACVDVCMDAGVQCGDLDGVDCGSCATTEVCSAGACVAPCITAGAECGPLTWSGQQVDCGTCAAGTCFANQCAAPGFRAIDGGFAHTCVVSSNGQMNCWGSNEQGTLGGPGSDSSVPVSVAGLSGMSALSTFNQHVCASKPTGAWCWGVNGVGQLGSGSLTASPSPVAVVGAFDYTQVAAGGAHSCALRSDGTAECWGINGQGQLGTGMLGGQSTSPVDVISLTGIVAITAGSAHSCALRDDGNVYCWGWNDKGQLGNAMSAASTPTRVTVIPPVISIAAGGSHTCAVSEDLEVWCWGDGTAGQLGRGSTASSNVPVKATMTAAVRVIAGSQHSCAIDTGRRIWCWGANASGQLGINSRNQANTPTQVSTLTNVLDAGAGFDHTCATRDDGTAWCWGSNASGQIGNNSAADALSPAAVAP